MTARKQNFVCVMPCCFRRIHKDCLVKWATAIHDMQRNVRKGEVGSTAEGESIIFYMCECGSYMPRTFFHKDPGRVYNEWKDQMRGQLYDQIAITDHFDKFVGEEPNASMGTDPEN